MKLELFKVEGLFLEKNYEININDNTLIVIADNGSGKTTILRIIYLFLTKQWAQLCKYQFISITAVIDGSKYEFEHDMFIKKKVSKKIYTQLSKKYSTFSNFILNDFSKFNITELKTDNFIIDEIELKYDVPKNLIYTLIDDLENSTFSDNKFDWKVNVIYLPTYRRIERDYFSLYGDINSRVAIGLLNLFPEIGQKIKDEKVDSENSFSDSEEQLNKLFANIIDSRNNEKWIKNNSNQESLEMIEFGMSDISFKVGLYIERNPLDYSKIINAFIVLINKYFSTDKQLIFDFESRLFYLENKSSNKYFSLETLSSGEKQLISIFSHLYFDDNELFLIIDEPEISLSLFWQEMILQDILHKSLGLIVATHSPFIVNESLKKYTAGINEFIV